MRKVCIIKNQSRNIETLLGFKQSRVIWILDLILYYSFCLYFVRDISCDNSQHSAELGKLGEILIFCH